MDRTPLMLSRYPTLQPLKLPEGLTLHQRRVATGQQAEADVKTALQSGGYEVTCLERPDQQHGFR